MLCTIEFFHAENKGEFICFADVFFRGKVRKSGKNNAKIAKDLRNFFCKTTCPIAFSLL